MHKIEAKMRIKIKRTKWLYDKTFTRDGVISIRKSNTRIGTSRQYCYTSRNTICITIKGNRLVLHIATAADCFPERDEHIFCRLHVMRANTLFQCLSSFPSIVVRNPAANMVKHMRFSNAMEKPRTDESEPFTVNRAKGSSWERPHRSMVVRELHICVLQVRNHDKPVICPHVRYPIVSHHIKPAVGSVPPPRPQHRQSQQNPHV